MRILVLCTGNSCRSQMAHGFLQSFDRHIEVYSAGTSPAKHVHPIAISVMSEVGIDISHHIPQKVEQYLNEQWDYVITVCGGANETCPTFVGKVGKRIHIGFDDPSNVVGSKEHVISEFRRVREDIRKAFRNFYVTHVK